MGGSERLTSVAVKKVPVSFSGRKVTIGEFVSDLISISSISDGEAYGERSLSTAKLSMRLVRAVDSYRLVGGSSPPGPTILSGFFSNWSLSLLRFSQGISSFHRTHFRVYATSNERMAVLSIYLTQFDEHRDHSSLKLKPPITQMSGEYNIAGIHAKSNRVLS